MPLALILNELLTNAAKHGAKGREGASIKVGLTRSSDVFVLHVEDDGAGFDLEEVRRRSSGLGLVTGLARQLGGTFNVERTPGARCVVRFLEQRGRDH
jgi:two-component sensor histidine kinase